MSTSTPIVCSACGEGNFAADTQQSVGGLSEVTWLQCGECAKEIEFGGTDIVLDDGEYLTFVDGVLTVVCAS